MEKSTISAILEKDNSNLKVTNVLQSIKYLAERGYEVELMLGCGLFDTKMFAKNI